MAVCGSRALKRRLSAADYQQNFLRAFGKSRTSFRGLLMMQKLLEAQKRALDTASELLRLQRVNYSGGGIGVANLLDAQRQLGRRS